MVDFETPPPFHTRATVSAVTVVTVVVVVVVVVAGSAAVAVAAVAASTLESDAIRPSLPRFELNGFAPRHAVDSEASADIVGSRRPPMTNENPWHQR